MTVIMCPHGCGETVNTLTDKSCPECKRSLASHYIDLSTATTPLISEPDSASNENSAKRPKA